MGKNDYVYIYMYKAIHIYYISVEKCQTLQPVWRRNWQPTPVFLPGESHRQRSLAGYKQSDVTERLSMHARISPARLWASDSVFLIPGLPGLAEYPPNTQQTCGKNKLKND